MKQRIAQFLVFYFLLGSLLPGADFSQLSKLADTFEHYKLHQQLAIEQNQDFNCMRFVFEHFLGASSHDHGDNDQSHQDLPLKHLQTLDNLIIPNAWTLPVSFVPACVLTLNYAKGLLPQSHLHGIFRPPISA